MTKTYSFHYNPLQKQIDQKAFLWEILYLLARPIVEVYTSDFYHDALWIERNIGSETVTFYYMAGKSGTTIIDKPDRYRTLESTMQCCRAHNRSHVWLCTLSKPVEAFSQQWSFTVEEIAE